jgi:hypothetical protein
MVVPARMTVEMISTMKREKTPAKLGAISGRQTSGRHGAVTVKLPPEAIFILEASGLKPKTKARARKAHQRPIAV